MNNEVTCEIIASPIERNSEGGGDVPDEFRVITFTIDGVSYEGLNGITFEEWSRNSANIDEIVQIKNDAVYYNNQPLLLDSSSIVEAGKQYYTLSNSPYIKVGEIVTQFNRVNSDLILVTYDSVNDYLFIQNKSGEKIEGVELPDLVEGSHYDIIDENCDSVGNE